ncbi:hypothetical protein DPMN_168557 [Dreissena polymorpha]|uniref:Uncharacterized protein n=1 Tax=Dreissena polymorpha TaxID=45954 RepID=A0A9D4F0V8_DREPO|nr:hypothetical protein DPMN_168557 [Dreissena polymorpha]
MLHAKTSLPVPVPPATPEFIPLLFPPVLADSPPALFPPPLLLLLDPPPAEAPDPPPPVLPAVTDPGAVPPFVVSGPEAAFVVELDVSDPVVDPV